jgi:metal-responsive CopG/Arc/MetJ family transcriptional regulator
VRLSDEVLTAIDEAVKKLGGNRSDFIRRAIEMRLEWTDQMQHVSTLPLVKQ